MTADNSTAVSQQQPVSSRQLNSSQSAATSQQRQLSSSQSATASSGTTSQQQPAKGQPVSSSATQKQSGSNNQLSRQPVDNRELSHNQTTKAAQQQPVTTTTSVNNFFGPAPMINNHRAEGVCQMQPQHHITTTGHQPGPQQEAKALQAGSGAPIDDSAASLCLLSSWGSVWEHQHNEEKCNMTHQKSSKASAFNTCTH